MLYDNNDDADGSSDGDDGEYIGHSGATITVYT